MLFYIKLDTGQFKPKMLVNEITTHRTTLNAKIWICELQYRDHTVSEVLNEMLDRFEALGFKPN